MAWKPENYSVHPYECCHKAAALKLDDERGHGSEDGGLRTDARRAEVTIKVGNATQLFLDADLVQAHRGMRLVAHRPSKAAGKLAIVAEHAWEHRLGGCECSNGRTWALPRL